MQKPEALNPKPCTCPDTLDRYDPKTERAAFTYYGIHFQTTAAKAGSQQAAEAHWAARYHTWSWNLDMATNQKSQKMQILERISD